jgi:hypothetical protein
VPLRYALPGGEPDTLAFASASMESQTGDLIGGLRRTVRRNKAGLERGAPPPCHL